MKTCHSHITPFALHLRKIEIHFILREINNILGITFSRRNVHFSHLLAVICAITMLMHLQ